MTGTESANAKEAEENKKKEQREKGDGGTKGAGGGAMKMLLQALQDWLAEHTYLCFS